MKKQYVQALAGIVGVLCVVGCSDRSHDRLALGEVYTNRVQVAFDALQPADILAKVNRRTLTKLDLDERVMDEFAIAVAANAEYFSKAPQEVENYRKKMRSLCLNQFVVYSVVLEEADRRNIEPTPEDMQAASEMIDKICAVRKISRKEYVATFARKEVAVAERMRKEATMRALFREQFGPKLAVTDEEVTKLQEELKENNRFAEFTNTMFRTTLERLSEKLHEGADRLPDSLTAVTNPLPRGIFVECVEERLDREFDDPNTAMELAGLKLRQWSPIIDMEETLDLYYIIDRQKDADSNQTRYKFIRFYAKKDLGFLVPEFAELKNDIARRRREALQPPWIIELHKKVRISYPKGVAWLEN